MIKKNIQDSNGKSLENSGDTSRKPKGKTRLQLRISSINLEESSQEKNCEVEVLSKKEKPIKEDEEIEENLVNDAEQTEIQLDNVIDDHELPNQYKPEEEKNFETTDHKAESVSLVQSNLEKEQYLGSELLKKVVEESKPQMLLEEEAVIDLDVEPKTVYDPAAEIKQEADLSTSPSNVSIGGSNLESRLEGESNGNCNLTDPPLKRIDEVLMDQLTKKVKKNPEMNPPEQPVFPHLGFIWAKR